MAHLREIRPGAWQIVVKGDPDLITGRRRQRTKVVHGDRGEAEAFAVDFERDVREGRLPDDGSITVGRFIDPFIETRSRSWAPTTIAWYRSKLRHLGEAMGDRRLNTVTGRQLTALYAKLTRRGLSGTTLGHVHSAVRAMLNKAVKWEYLDRSPADRAEPPTGDTAERAIWSVDDLTLFLTGTAEHRWHVAWALTALTGMRRGEVAGLRWDDVDLDVGVLRIRQSVTSVRGRIVTGPTKTRGSRRTISLDEGTVELLRAHRRAQLEERTRAGAGWVDSGMVYTWEDGRQVNPDRLNRAFRRECQRLELEPIGLTGLRHGWATMAIEAGVHIRVVSGHLGHSTPSVTLNVYSHVVDRMDRDAAEKVARLVRTR